MALGTYVAFQAWTGQNIDTTAPVVRFGIDPPGAPHALVTRTVAVSPDGSSVAYVSDGMLWLRLLERLDAAALLEIGFFSGEPFFSADGAWICVLGESGIRKVPVGGAHP